MGAKQVSLPRGEGLSGREGALLLGCPCIHPTDRVRGAGK